MNLEESNEIFEQNKQKNAKKKAIAIGIILCTFIIIFCVVGIAALKKHEEQKYKLFINGKKYEKLEGLIIEENGEQYVDIKLLAKLTGSDYMQGDYVEVNESKEACYIENDYEVVSFKADENTFEKFAKNKIVTTGEEVENTTKDSKKASTKNSNKKEDTQEKVVYAVKSNDGEKFEFSIEKPIKLIKEKLYIPIELVGKAFNAVIKYDGDKTQISTLDYLVVSGQKLASSLGYTEVSSSYENLKAIADGLLVVGNEGKYGVISLKDNSVVLSLKYDDLKYVQNEENFYVYLNSKVGLVDSKGEVIIATTANYESIETFDVDKNLYLVKNEGKYGLIDGKGEVILHTDFDLIGINNIEKFKLKEKNDNLWFDKIVAIKKGAVYGLYNIETKENILEINYDGFGYMTKTTDKLGEESVILIPKETGVEGIVIILNGMYGIFDINSKNVIIPCLCNRIYSLTNNGITKYYMDYQDFSAIEMEDYFIKHDMITAR